MRDGLRIMPTRQSETPLRRGLFSAGGEAAPSRGPWPQVRPELISWGLQLIAALSLFVALIDAAGGP